MDNEVFLKRTAIEDYQYNEAMKTLRTNIQFSGTGIQVVTPHALPEEPL